jgi:hypothetical protein
LYHIVGKIIRDQHKDPLTGFAECFSDSCKYVLLNERFNTLRHAQFGDFQRRKFASKSPLMGCLRGEKWIGDPSGKG